MHVATVEKLIRPAGVRAEKPAGRHRSLTLDSGAFFPRRGFGLLGHAVQEIEMVDERQSFDGEHGRYITVTNRDEVVAVYLLPAEGEVGRPAIDNRVLTVEPAHNEFVVHLMTEAADIRHLIEGRRQLRVDRLAGYENSLPASDCIELDAICGVRDSKTE